MVYGTSFSPLTSTDQKYNVLLQNRKKNPLNTQATIGLKKKHCDENQDCPKKVTKGCKN